MNTGDMESSQGISRSLKRLDGFLQSPSGAVLKDNASQILGICQAVKMQGQALQARIGMYVAERNSRLDELREKIPGAQRQLDEIIGIIKSTQQSLCDTIKNPSITQDPQAMVVVGFMQQNIQSMQLMFMDCYTKLLLL